MNQQRLLHRLLQGHLPNIRFSSFVRLVEGIGFHLVRVSGSHHIFSHPRIPVQLNIQDVNGEAKPYQIRQFLHIVRRYGLHLGNGST